MSNDQLSWEQILNQSASAQPTSETAAPEKSATEKSVAAKPVAEKSQEPGSVDESAIRSSATGAGVVEPKTADVKKSRRVKKPASAETKQASDASSDTLYSKKNWSKLEFPTNPSQPATASPAQGNGDVSLAQAKSGATGTTNAVSTNSAQAKFETAAAAPATPKTFTTQTSRRVPVADDVNRLAQLLADDDDLGEEDDEAGQEVSEPQVLTVSELNRHIREILEGRFPLLWLKGEISNFKAHTSGHFYFSLKDSKAQISAVMFRGFNQQLRFRPEDGMEVLIRGKVTVYEPRGNYQLFCELMEPVGAGALQKAFEQLKAKLQREGLFDEARKRPLPSLPRHIAIVTSPTGAAIRDMLNVLGRRFKGARITLVPCKVQGDAAPREIIHAIQLANRLQDVDVMIVGRGGGSIEDLWAFNDEGVARAISGSRIPVISAVGHEVDFTIADFVADLRAPTPSAAAELVVKNAADIVHRLATMERSLRLAVMRLFATCRQGVTAVARRLVDPQRRIQDAAMRCDELLQRLEASAIRSLDTRALALSPLETRLKTGIRNALLRKSEVLGRNAAVLDSLSPLKVLDRGYSMVSIGDRIVTDAGTLKAGESIEVRMCKGAVEAQVVKVRPTRT